MRMKTLYPSDELGARSSRRCSTRPSARTRHPLLAVTLLAFVCGALTSCQRPLGDADPADAATDRVVTRSGKGDAHTPERVMLRLVSCEHDCRGGLTEWMGFEIAGPDGGPRTYASALVHDRFLCAPTGLTGPEEALLFRGTITERFPARPESHPHPCGPPTPSVLKVWVSAHVTDLAPIRNDAPARPTGE